MPYCEKCGASVNEDAEFCRACGTPTGAATQPGREGAPVVAPTVVEERLHKRAHRGEKMVATGEQLNEASKVLGGCGCAITLIVLSILLIVGFVACMAAGH